MPVPLTIRDFIDRAVTVYGDRIALLDEPAQPAPSWGQITYRDLGMRARSQAAYLDKLGLQPGSRVAIVSHNSARMLCSFFGVSGWGRVLVPVNHRLTPDEVRYIVEHSGAELLLLDPELSHLREAVPTVPSLIFGVDDAAMWECAAEPVFWDEDEEATATINYTSGTTSRPKGVELTHRNNWLNATVFGWQATVTDRDVYLHTLPLFHANGWGHPFAATAMGATHILLRKVDGEEILRRIQRHGVTYLCAAPAVVSSILAASRLWSGPVPGRGKVRVIVAGAPPPRRTIERVRDELGWEFIQIYGLTETAPLLTMSRMRSEWDELPQADQAALLSRAGAPALGIRVRVDESGEVLVRSNHNMKGYWNNAEATSEALDGSWFRTGDGGELRDGYLTISDRKKDVIITGGENVSSIEVEDVLSSHPSVKEAAVIGIPDETWGELVTALVVLEAGTQISPSELQAHCRATLAGYKCPKRIEIRSELVRTATGKLQKFKLREEFWSDQERQVN